jgi:mRNA-degrading endonuclease RelE of RelBE toxin-antitoxin system
MIRYTVIWRPQAESDLSRLWMSALDRQSIANASDDIDKKLATDPEKRGEAAAEGLRRLNVLPLTVLYDIETDDRRVTVLTVRLTT